MATISRPRTSRPAAPRILRLPGDHEAGHRGGHRAIQPPEPHRPRFDREPRVQLERPVSPNSCDREVRAAGAVFRPGETCLGMLASRHSERRKFYLYPEHIMLLPAEQRAFWRRLSSVLRSQELQDAFKRKFRGALERRFGRSIDRLTFHPVPMLLRDLGGYRIGIHGDSLNKAITVQFYLPRDDAQSHLGTILHEGRNGDAALRTTTLKFRPATGYAFPVVYHESWHSVARTSDADGERNTLMLTYYVQAGLFGPLLPPPKRAWLLGRVGGRPGTGGPAG